MSDLQDIKQRIASKHKETRLQAIREGLDFQQAGLKLARANLNDLAKFLRTRLINVSYCTLFDSELYILGNINQNDFAGVITSFF